MGKQKKDALVQFNRNNILETSKQLFLKNGVDKTTMDDIAKQADCSKSTIYVYFKSKDEIFNTIVFEYMLLLKEGIDESIHSFPDFKECYYAICNKMVNFQNQYPMYFESILSEISVKEEDFEHQPILKAIYEVGEEINASIEKFLQRGIENKYVRDDIQPSLTVFALWASICGIISLADKKKQCFGTCLHTDRQTFLDYSFEMLLRSILN